MDATAAGLLEVSEYLASLRPGHRFKGVPERITAPGFHLDERDEHTAPRDDVDLDPPHPPAMRQYQPAAAPQETDRLFFGREPLFVSRVGPIRRIAVEAALHAANLMRAD